MRQHRLFGDNASGAILSDCGKYRYQLWRTWDESKPKVLFIMLNPSTADASADDPTIRRCIGFAKAWGYGGIMVGNLFALRATDPQELKKIVFNEEHYFHADQNAQHLDKMAYQCKIIVYAYGNPPIDKYNEPVSCFYSRHHLGLTKAGNPKHPLYLPKNTTLTPMPPPQRYF